MKAQIDWKTLNVKAWWKTNALTIVSTGGGQWVGDCPRMIGHKQADSRCTFTEGAAPTITCPDPFCEKLTFQSLIKDTWKNGGWHCKKEDPIEDGAEDETLDALGYSPKGEYFYRNGRTGHIVSLSPSQHKELDLYSIIPSPAFWKEFSDSEEGISWKAVARKLMAKCQQRGYYMKGETRGSGIFLDKKRIVVNLGSSLIVNSPGSEKFEAVNMADFAGEFIYASPNRIHLPDPASQEELALIMPLLERLPFASLGGPQILAGALVCGYVAGALRWRPHFWLTGAPSTGKSTILNLVLASLQPIKATYYKGDTSAAGVRDALKNSSGLVILDELEKMSGSTDRMSNAGTIKRVDSIIEMLRSASETSTAAAAKGDPRGDGFQSQIRCCAFLSAVYHGVETAQDYRRFCFIKLKDLRDRERGQATTFANSIEKDLIETFNHDFALKLYAWAVYNSRYILDMIEYFRSVMLSFSSDPGECDQWGTVLGASWCLTHYGVQPTKEDILAMFKLCHEYREIEKTERADLDHGSVAYMALRTGMPIGEHYNIGERIDEMLTSPYPAEGLEAWLERYGIKVRKEDGVAFMLVHPNHLQLRKVMEMGGYRNYKQALLAYEGAEAIARVEYFSGVKASTVIKIPLGPVTIKPFKSREITAQDAAALERDRD